MTQNDLENYKVNTTLVPKFNLLQTAPVQQWLNARLFQNEIRMLKTIIGIFCVF